MPGGRGREFPPGHREVFCPVPVDVLSRLRLRSLVPVLKYYLNLASNHTENRLFLIQQHPGYIADAV